MQFNLSDYLWNFIFARMSNFKNNHVIFLNLEFYLIFYLYITEDIPFAENA